jgi:hypothetical protein
VRAAAVSLGDRRKRPGSLRGNEAKAEEYRHRLIQETERSQRLAQELRELKSSDSIDKVKRERKCLIIENERLKAVIAKHGISVGQQRRMTSLVEDPNINYLLSQFINKAQASVEIDPEFGLLVLNAGTKSALSSALERLIL